MKNLIIIILSFLSVLNFSFAQSGETELQKALKYLDSKGEVYFTFEVFDKSRLNDLSLIISIDNVNGNIVYAYANKTEFKNFLKLKISFKTLPHPGDIDFDPNMKSRCDSQLDWDFYPTYDAYIAMMTQFAADYPNLCRIVNAGSTVQGRQILFAVISDNVNTPEAEPKFMYTSSMHGDETTGYILMLRLIDYLLRNYTTMPKVSKLVNNIEIWINPLANPDGTYRGGNNTVNGAVRYNFNNYDLNRNYPGVDAPNTQPIQPETQVFINNATANYFRFSANFHGGAEVVNYPWDCWSRLAADNNWWIRVSRKYADTVHVYAPSGYMNYLNNGITNGYAWYYVRGCRQDYMIYYKRGRESTIELSDVKLLPPAQLPALWDYNYRSLLNYIEQAMYGITGTVTDSLTGLPLKAKVTAVGFDIDSSEVYSDSAFGKYYRMAIQGSYNLMFSAPGYYSKTIPNIYALNDSAVTVNVQLRPVTTGITGNPELPGEFALYQNYPNPFNPVTVIKFSVPAVNSATVKNPVKLIVYNVLGNEIDVLINEHLQPGTYEVKWNALNFAGGIYFCKFSSGTFTDTKKMLLIK